jgi:hypothetical protein
MNTIIGTLLYYGANGSWTITGKDGSVVDLKPLVMGAFAPLLGRRVVMNEKKWSLTICADEQAPMHLESQDGTIWPILQVRDGFGFSNVRYAVEQVLTRFNGTTVGLCWDENSLSILFDEVQSVPRTQYCGRGNLALAEPGGRCLNPTPCVFLVAGPDGFRCAKFDSFTSAQILDRLIRGEMKATRIGSCVVDGRVAAGAPAETA